MDTPTGWQTTAAQPLRMLARIASAAIAVLLLVPTGAAPRTATTPGMSLCTQVANRLISVPALAPDTAPTFIVTNRPTHACAIQPRRSALFAAKAARHGVLITSRMGGRYGP